MRQRESSISAAQATEWSLILTETRCAAEGCEEITVYGICACQGGLPQVRIEDISSCREVVEELIERCTRNSVSAEELLEIVEDFLP